jgi:DNA-binding SARP family transcriptional activator
VTRTRTTRGEVAAALWPELEPEAAAGNLRVTLRYLHRVLEPERDPGAAPWYVRSRGEVLELVPEMLVVDAWEMERLLDAAEAADHESRAGDVLAHLREALAWWRGEFAGDLYDEWIDHERSRLRARFLAGAVRTGELLLGRGAVDEALALGTRAVQAEPWSEPAYRLVASAHLARGDRASTRRTLERCRAMLDDLGVSADAETEMLWRRTDQGAGQPAPERPEGEPREVGSRRASEPARGVARTTSLRDG